MDSSEAGVHFVELLLQETVNETSFSHVEAVSK
jgi:hypothetical protein